MVVLAHPAEDSFNTAVFQAVTDGLAERRLPFSSVRIGQGDELTPSAFATTEQLIAVYPTWYGSLPAMLLAAMADVLAPWVDDGKPTTTSPLRSLKSVKVITSHGSSKLVNLVQGEPGRHFWKRTVLPLCAPGATFGWKALYKLDSNDAATRAAFINDAASFASL